MRRLHVVIRWVALGALASIGCSSAYWLLYLALPVLAAILIGRDGSEGYFRDDAPAAIAVLRWLAAAYAYLWLLTDALPTREGQGPVELSVEVSGKPTPSSALWRLVMSLPALVVLALLSIVAAILWIFGSIAILATERMPLVIADFIEMKLRYQFRLVAYHLSLVDVYPAVTDSPQPHVPRAGST